jgi:protocatechuate 3,4-dioxygenase beta subunit
MPDIMATPVSVSAMVLFAALVLGTQPVAQTCDKRAPTPETSPGPHDFSIAPGETSLWREGDDGEPLYLQVRVLDTCGKAVKGARVRILHADQDGEHHPQRWRTHLTSDDGGEIKLVTVYPGYAGYMARHIHFIVSHPDHRQLVTRLFFKNDPAIDPSIENLAIVVEEIRRGEQKGWVGGFEFVLPPK